MNRNNLIRKNNTQAKKVRFDTSQQWRLSRRQIQANGIAPNRNLIKKNLSLIKSGATPLKRAQAAYYGQNASKGNSPMLSIQTKKAKIDNRKLPVHARLGLQTASSTARLQAAANVSTPGNRAQPKTSVSIQQLLAQKRALRLKTIEQNKKLQQLQAITQQRNTNQKQKMPGKLRIDGINKTNFKTKKNVKMNRNRLMNGANNAVSASDLSVSIANDFALLNAPQIHIRRNLPQPNLHSSELNLQIQREISLIQDRSRRMKLDVSVPLSSSIAGLNPIGLVDNSLSHLGGITTSVIPVESRQKLSLHERFSLL